MDNHGSPDYLNANQAIDRLVALYEASLSNLREAISQYIDQGTIPDLQARSEGLFAYPQLEVSWDGGSQTPYRTRLWPLCSSG